MRKAKLRFDGLNVASVLSHFASEKIPFENVTAQGKNCFVTIPSVYVKQAVAYLQEKCYNVSVEEVGFSAALSFAKRRFAVVLAAVLLVVVLFVSSGFCLSVQVSGDADEQAVLSALSEQGVVVGVNMKNVDVDMLENAIATKLKLAYAVVNKSGSVLYVKTVAAKSAEPPLELYKRRDIVSSASGVVTEAVCLQGTLAVKVGDIVQKGDVLVIGKRNYSDGTEQNVYAMGRVTVRVCAQAFAPFDGFVTQLVPTGETFSSTFVTLFGKDYGKGCPYEHFEQTVSRTLLYPLAVPIKHVVFSQLATKRVAAKIEDVTDELKRRAYDMAAEKCDFAVVETEYEVSADGVTAKLFGYVSFS